MADADLVHAIESILNRETNPLQEITVAEQKPFFNHLFSALPTSEGVTTLWFDRDTSDNGSIDRDGADAVLHCDAAANEHAELETTERLNYVPGTSGVVGWTMMPERLPVGDQDQWIGATDQTDGIGVGVRNFDVGEGTPTVTSSGVQPYIFYEKTGQSRIRIPQEHWNRDTLDGSGGDGNPSGEDINDFLDGAIVRIDPQLYYGHGIYTIKILSKRGTNEFDLGGGGVLYLDDASVDLIAAHDIVVKEHAMLDQPNVPITARAETNATGTQAVDLHWTAAHYERARSESEIRLNGETRRGVDVDTAWEPVISWRKRSGWEQVNSRPIAVIVASDTDLVLELELGTDLNGASFGIPTHTSSSEAALEFDISATGFASGGIGERRWLSQVTGGQGSSRRQAGGTLNFNLPANRNLTLAAKADAANAEVDAVALTGSEF